jgi:hypothetical protein
MVLLAALLTALLTAISCDINIRGYMIEAESGTFERKRTRGVRLDSGFFALVSYACLI